MIEEDKIIKVSDEEIPFISDRVIAFFIDSIVYTFPISFIIGLFLFPFISMDFVRRNTDSIVLLLSILPYISLILRDSWTGKSLGKKIYKMEIVNFPDKAKVDSKLLLAVRNIPSVILLPLEFLLMAFNRERRRFGDIITKTIVIQKNEPGNK